MKLIIILVVVLSGCSYPGEKWTKTNYALHGVMTTTMAADWLQTKEIARNDRWHEKNKILGKHPNQKEVNLYFLGAWIFNTGITHFTKSQFRFVPQIGVTAIHGKAVIDNHNLGIRVNF